MSTTVALTQPAATEAPGWANPRVAPAVRSPKSITLHATSHDPQSGIAAFEYVFSELPDGAEAFARTAAPGRMESETLEIENPPLSFTDSTYLHVRAVNAAGLAGPVTTRVLRAVDSTRPSTPLLRAMAVDGGARLYLPRLSTDPDWARGGEQGVIYQVAAGTAPGAMDVIPWSAGLFFREADLRGVTVSPGGGFQGVTSGYFLVPANRLRSDRPLYFSIRAVNPAGNSSDVVVSGPVDSLKAPGTGGDAGSKYTFPGVKP